MNVFEIRSYHIRDGGIDEWVELMENKVAPFLTERGVKIHAMFRGVEDANSYVWIRSFENEEERQRLTKQVLGSSYWQEEVKPTVLRLLDREQNIIQVLHSAAGSFGLQPIE